MNQDVLVIGGGLAGLAAAVELCRAGLSVTLLERQHRLGGRARSCPDQHSGTSLDLSPPLLLPQYHHLLHFLEGLGSAEHIVWQRGQPVSLVGKAQPFDIGLRRLPCAPHFLPSLLDLPQLSPRDLAANRYLLWQVARLSEQDLQHLDTLDAQSYLRQQELSEHFIDWFWRSACLNVLGLPLDCCSAAALLRAFRLMGGSGDQALGFPDRPLEELFVPAAQALLEARGGRLLLNSGVSALRLRDQRLCGVLLDDGRRLDASCCVAALPPAALRELLPAPWLENDPALARVFESLGRWQYSPVVCSHLWFDRKLTHERYWTRVWSPDMLNCRAQDLSNIRAGWETQPSLIASTSVHNPQAALLDDEELLRRSLEELADYLPQLRGARLRHASVQRVPQALPAPRPGAERLRLPTRSPLAGLLLAGDWTATGLPASLESAVCSGYRAAEAALAELGRPRALPGDASGAEGRARRLGSSRG